MFSRRVFRALLSCPIGLLAAAAVQAAGVSRVAPEALFAFLRANPQVVVSYNSPDPNCGFCGKVVDQAFADVARGFGDDVKFISVQWAPWKTFPAAATWLGISGIPAHQVLRNGDVVHVEQGRLKQPAEFVALVRGLFPLAVAAAAPPPASAPLPVVSPAPVKAVAPGPLIVPSPVVDGAPPVAGCDAFRYLTDRSRIPWAVNGADATFCGQTAIGFYPLGHNRAISAFRQRQFVGLRDESAGSPNREWATGIVADAARLTSGYTETPGELWWGFLKEGKETRQVAIGQETHTRLFASMSATDPRRAADLQMGKLQPPYPRSPESRYQLADATPVTSDGLGGRGPIADGRVVRAELTITPKDPMQGALRIDLEIEGASFNLTLPLKRNLIEEAPRSIIRPSEMNQLVSGIAGAGGAVVDCLVSPGSGTREPCTMQRPGGRPGSKMRYTAQVLFFGPQSNLAVVTFRLSDLSWDGANGRAFVNSNGLVVLRAQ